MIKEAFIELKIPGRSGTNHFMIPGRMQQFLLDTYDAESKIAERGLRVFLTNKAENRLIGIQSEADYIDLTIHTLQPYTGWEDFSNRMTDAVVAFREITKQQGTSEICVRYINEWKVSGTEIQQRIKSYSPRQGILTRHLINTIDIYNDAELAITEGCLEAHKDGGTLLLDLSMTRKYSNEALPLNKIKNEINELHEELCKIYEGRCVRLHNSHSDKERADENFR